MFTALKHNCSNNSSQLEAIIIGEDIERDGTKFAQKNKNCLVYAAFRFAELNGGEARVRAENNVNEEEARLSELDCESGR